MFAWLTQNLGTVLVTLALVLIVAAALRHLVRKKGAACSCGCEGCGCICEKKPRQ